MENMDDFYQRTVIDRTDGFSSLLITRILKEIKSENRKDGDYKYTLRFRCAGRGCIEMAEYRDTRNGATIFMMQSGAAKNTFFQRVLGCAS